MQALRAQRLFAELKSQLPMNRAQRFPLWGVGAGRAPQCGSEAALEPVEAPMPLACL